MMVPRRTGSSSFRPKPRETCAGSSCVCCSPLRRLFLDTALSTGGGGGGGGGGDVISIVGNTCTAGKVLVWIAVLAQYNTSSSASDPSFKSTSALTIVALDAARLEPLLRD